MVNFLTSIEANYYYYFLHIPYFALFSNAGSGQIIWEEGKTKKCIIFNRAATDEIRRWHSNMLLLAAHQVVIG